MRRKLQISGRTVVAPLALVLFAGNLLAAGQPTVSFSLSGTGIGGSLDGVYTSPYQGTISGITGTVPVICDDFANNSYVPENWTAYVTSLSSINTGTDTPGDLLWNNAKSGGTVDGSSWDLGNQQTAYDVAAYLAIEIMNCGTTATPYVPGCTLPSAASEDLSYALWELFDATGASSMNLPALSDNVKSWLSGDSSTLSAATGYVESAINAVCATGCTTVGGVTTVNSNTTVSALTGWSVNIYSVDPPPGGPYGGTGGPITCSGTCSATPPQEFITVSAASGMTYSSPMPEPSSPAVLGVYCLFGGASLLFFGRRRLFKNGN